MADRFNLQDFLTGTTQGSVVAEGPWEALEELGFDPDEIEVISHSPDKTSINFVFRGRKYCLTTRPISRSREDMLAEEIFGRFSGDIKEGPIQRPGTFFGRTTPEFVEEEF